MTAALAHKTAPAQSHGAPAVVAIGASAGGLEALQTLLAGLKANGRTAYVVAQHMRDASHHDLMLQLLQRSCPLPVRLLAHGDTPVADMVQLAPAGCHAIWQEGRWALQPLSPRYFSAPSVDALLISLAQGLGDSAAAVILSGAGHDGAQGAASLWRQGGSVWVQSPHQARFDGMPTAALQAVPDAAVLAVEDMARRWPWLTLTPTAVDGRHTSLDKLTGFVRQVTGVDFSGYKPETLLRRTNQRMAELRLASLQDYAAYLDAHPHEAWTLRRRFLVSVSSFFRDACAFEALAQAWRQDAQPGKPTWRCWVPACASGEEAYSLAMLHAEGLCDEAWTHRLEVLGTDLNESALEQARRGIYPLKAVREAGAARIQRHFQPLAGELEVAPALRAGVRFAAQDLLATLPDGPWDTISCRNLLIYLQTPLQERLIARFHQSLKPGGWLFLGSSETLTQASLRGFAPYDMDHRIYRRLP